MYDVVALGELVVDFTPLGLSDAGHPIYERNLGGAPANVLCGLAGLGHPTALIGKVGDDGFGRFMADTLVDRGVQTSGLVFDPDVFTTLAFVHLDARGERSFDFCRKPGADAQLRAAEVDTAQIEQARIFHTSAFQTTHEPGRSATHFALQFAKERGITTAFDPNYRDVLWPSAQAAREQILALLPLVDLLKVSEEEAALITGESDPERAAKALMVLGPRCVAVTLGAAGVYVAGGTHGVRCPAFEVPVVDTTGAGDAFWAGFLSCLLETRGAIGPVSQDGLAAAATKGCAAAAICVGGRGGIGAPVTPEGIQAFRGRA